jgi:hypothetical protein
VQLLLHTLILLSMILQHILPCKHVLILFEWGQVYEINLKFSSFLLVSSFTIATETHLHWNQNIDKVINNCICFNHWWENRFKMVKICF